MDGEGNPEGGEEMTDQDKIKELEKRIKQLEKQLLKESEWYFILDHDASFGHYNLCPVCGQVSPTTSRICPYHQIYYVMRQSTMRVVKEPLIDAKKN